MATNNDEKKAKVKSTNQQTTVKKPNKATETKEQKTSKPVASVPIDKLIGYFLNIDTKTGFRYTKNGINVNSFTEENKSQEITDEIDPLDIEGAIMKNKLFITDKDGKDMTEKLYKKYEPAILHVWNNPKSITADPMEAALAPLMDDAVSDMGFLKAIDTSSKETITIIYNLFKDLTEKSHLQEQKWKLIKRRYIEIS